MVKRPSGKASGDTGRERPQPASIEANPSPTESAADSKRRSTALGGHDNVSAGASPRARPPPGADSLAKAIETQRVQLVRVHAVVLSNISVLRESYGLELDGADVCYCCEVVRDILDRVIANLDLVRVIVSPDCEPYMRLDVSALGYMVATTRHQLFRAQAVTFALARLLKADAKDSYEANLRVVFASLGAIMEETITQLEPDKLGLPTPKLA